MSQTVKLRDRVIASLNGTGYPRRGTVVGVIGNVAPPPGRGKYLVHFDGDGGLTGPCVVLDVLVSMSP